MSTTAEERKLFRRWGAAIERGENVGIYEIGERLEKKTVIECDGEGCTESVRSCGWWQDSFLYHAALTNAGWGWQHIPIIKYWCPKCYQRELESRRKDKGGDK